MIIDNAFLVVLVVFALYLVKEMLLMLPLIKPTQYDITQNNIPSVSLIIAARNEAENLRHNMESWMGQKGVKLEVVVIDDRSTDDTFNILTAYQQRFKNLEVVSVRSTGMTHEGKKMALTLGVKRASNETLVFTDADCVPSSPHWLKHMAETMEKHPVVIGPAPHRGGGGFVALLARIDTFLIMRQYLGVAKLGAPYMGVGRNIGFKKSTFMTHGGYKRHIDLKSGDDDLFVNEIASKVSVGVVFHRDAVLISKPKTTLSEWFIQKNRHTTTFDRYRLGSKVMLSVILLLNILPLVASGWYVWVSPQNYEMLLLAVAITIGFVSLLRWFAAKAVKEPSLAIFSAILSPVLGFMYPLSTIYGWLNRQEWKS